MAHFFRFRCLVVFQVLMQINDTKIQFKIGKIKLVSKVIDGKFPDYKKVVPSTNDKTLLVSSKDPFS